MPDQLVEIKRPVQPGLFQCTSNHLDPEKFAQSTQTCISLDPQKYVLILAENQDTDSSKPVALHETESTF